MLFRQIGGSIGVAAVRHDLRQPPARATWRSAAAGASLPKSAEPGRDPAPAAGGPRRVRRAVATALHAGLPGRRLVGVVAFALTWLLREVPLRKTPGVGETAGETFGLEEAA